MRSQDYGDHPSRKPGSVVIRPIFQLIEDEPGSGSHTITFYQQNSYIYGDMCECCWLRYGAIHASTSAMCKLYDCHNYSLEEATDEEDYSELRTITQNYSELEG